MSKSLIYFRTKNPFQRGSIEINDAFYNLLKNKYSLGHRFKECSEFLVDYKLWACRSIKLSSIDFTTFSVDKFQVKINNKRAVSFLESNKKQIILKKNPSITVKFVRIHKSQASVRQLEILKNFNKKKTTDAQK